MVKLISSLVTVSLAISQLASAAKLYQKDEAVPITVKPLTPGGNSHDDKLYLYPIDYYNPTLDSCAPKNQRDPYNLEKPLEYIYQSDDFFGNHLSNAPISTTFQNGSSKCAHMCDKNYNKANVTLINNLIKRNYKLNFFIDDVPVGRELYDSQTKKFYIDNGVPMGYLDLDKIPHLFNHFQFVVYYVSYGLEYEILYATVSTRSITRVPVVPLGCMLTPPLMLRYNDNSYNGNRVSYDILWKEVHVNKWSQKWELYHNDVVKPFISNAVVVIFTILTAIVAFYTYLTVSNAFNTEKLEFIYKTRQKLKTVDEQTGTNTGASSSSEDIVDDIEFSWPSLINDVFRIPNFSPFLYTLVSNGIHITLVSTIVILFLSFGALDVHSFENELARCVLNVYIFTTPLPSLINCYFFKKFDSSSPSSVESFKKKLTQTILSNSFAIPAVLFAFVKLTNDAYASVDSPTQISWKIYQHLSVYYIGITLITFFAGLKFIKVAKYPSSDISKKISNLPVTFQTVPNMTISGIFPFGVILIPLSSIYISLWYSHFYSNSTLTISYLLLLTLTVAISILNVYHSLSIGNWKWQWYSFLSGFAVGIYTFAYSFYLTKFKFGDRASMMIFLLQNLGISSLLGLIGGSVAFIASYYFVKNLYAGLLY